MPGQMMRRRTRRAPRRFKKRLTGYRKRKVIRSSPRGMIGFPSQRVVRMRYTKNFTLDSSGAIIEYPIAANDISNPDAGTSTGRPLGYKQWGTFYKEWLVIGSKIRIMPVYASTTAGTIPLTYGVYLMNDSDTAGTIGDIIEQGRCKYRTLQPIQNGAYQPIRYSFSPKKWFNMAQLKDNANELAATFATDGSGAAGPSKTVFYNVFVRAADGTTNVQAVNFTVQIDYLVMLRQPLLLQPSVSS